MKHTLKNRPIKHSMPYIPVEWDPKGEWSQYKHDNEEWFEDFKDELLNTPLGELVGQYPRDYNEIDDATSEEEDAYHQGFNDGVKALIDKILGEEAG